MQLEFLSEKRQTEPGKQNIFWSYFPGSYLFSDQKLKLFTKSRFSHSSTYEGSELDQSLQG